MTDTIRALGRTRGRALVAFERAHRHALNAVVAELERNPDANLTALARLAGVTKQTIYNELARRQTTRDTLSANGAPAPAPHDRDRGEPTAPRRRRR